MCTVEKLFVSARRLLSLSLALCALTWAPAAAVRAELITPEDMAAVEAAATREKLVAMFAREDVRSELVAYGVDADEAAARVAALSDAEIAIVAKQIEDAPAGASFAGAVGGALLLLGAILVVTDLLGYTDVFPFLDPLPGRTGSGV